MNTNVKKEVRVLTFSIDVWNKLSGSDTLTNLFSGYDGGKIANIYFKSGIPDNTKCDRYYFVSENMILKNFFNKNATNGIQVNAEEKETKIEAMGKEHAKEKSRYKFFSKYRFWIFQYAREIIWKYGKWNSTELEAFVDKFAPDVLFFPIEGYIYFNRITEYFLNRLQVPAIGIIWDDNFTYKVHPYNLGFLIYRFFLRKQFKRIAEKCSALYVISPKMKRELFDEFGISAEILTKGAILKKNQDGNKSLEQTIQTPIRIVYTGKLNIGRLDTIKVLVDAIDKINSKNVLYELYVYSGTQLNEKQRKSIDKKGCFFMGQVSQDKIDDIQNEADILLLAEALKGIHKNVARLSFSTKTVDYLSKNKCIFYIGTENNATAEYLQANKAALFAATHEQIMNTLQNVLVKKDIMQAYGKKAYLVATENHDINKVQECLYNAIDMVSKNEKM